MNTETLDLQAEEPLYRQLRLILVKDGGSSPGKLPSVKEIARRHRVSVVTVLKAIEGMKAEGLVFSRPGKGIYVKDRKKLRDL